MKRPFTISSALIFSLAATEGIAPRTGSKSSSTTQPTCGSRLEGTAAIRRPSRGAARLLSGLGLWQPGPRDRRLAHRWRRWRGFHGRLFGRWGDPGHKGPRHRGPAIDPPRNPAGGTEGFVSGSRDRLRRQDSTEHDRIDHLRRRPVPSGRGPDRRGLFEFRTAG